MDSLSQQCLACQCASAPVDRSDARSRVTCQGRIAASGHRRSRCPRASSVTVSVGRRARLARCGIPKSVAPEAFQEQERRCKPALSFPSTSLQWAPATSPHEPGNLSALESTAKEPDQKIPAWLAVGRAVRKNPKFPFSQASPVTSQRQSSQHVASAGRRSMKLPNLLS